MIRHILFDLDNTLYSAKFGLGEMYYVHLRRFVSHLLGVSLEEGTRLQIENSKRCGTTIRWLTSEKGFTDLDAYFANLHPENEADSLSPDPELRKFLENLPCPSSILTNSPLFHAQRILKKMELEGIFQHIFDIIGNNLEGKPDPLSYRRALEKIGLKSEEVLFVDDIPRYVEGYLAIGGRGILFDEMDMYKDYPHERIKNIYELDRYL